MLVGNILAVSWHEVWQDGDPLRVIGVFHCIFRKQFLAISMNHDDAEATGTHRAAAGTSCSMPRSASS